jgi:hypothetical protein
MNQQDYCSIILDGWLNHTGFLTEHFKREGLKAESCHVSHSEFFQRLEQVIEQAEHFKREQLADQWNDLPESDLYEDNGYPNQACDVGREIETLAGLSWEQLKQLAENIEQAKGGAYTKDATDLSRREILIKLYRERGEMNRIQLLAVAKEYGFKPESFADFYTRNFDEIKKSAIRLK